MAGDGSNCGTCGTCRIVRRIAVRRLLRFRLGGFRRPLRSVAARLVGLRGSRRLQRAVGSRHERELRRERGPQSGPAAGRSLGLRLSDRRQLRAKRFLREPDLTIDDTCTSAPRIRKQYFATAAIFQSRRVRRIPVGRGLRLSARHLLSDDQPATNPQRNRLRHRRLLRDRLLRGLRRGRTGPRRSTASSWTRPTCSSFYLRRNFENGGDGRLWGGATGNGDGLLGVDLWVPLGQGFCPGKPDQLHDPQAGHAATSAQPRESWGLVVQLVWYPGQNARCQQQNPYRPMFNVADNSLFMVDRLINH